MNGKSSYRISPLTAWAFAFGTAVGWGSFAMPGTMLLPMAGPLGTVVGVLAGTLIMCIIAWNYHIMISRYPGPGGTFSFASGVFGSDHGFLCAWFLCLTYVAIVWANATALAIGFRHLFWDALRFGMHYTLAGHAVYPGDILPSVAAIAVAAAICRRSRRAAMVQTVLALTFAACIAVCFASALILHKGGLSGMGPAFSPRGGRVLSQILKIVSLAPWFYVGFESISHLSGEFRFPLKRTFGVMVAALGTAAAAYALLAVMPALAADGGDWTVRVFGDGSAGEAQTLPVFAAAERALGKAGPVVIGLTILSAIFTNLVGNMVVASRLVGSMAEDAILPRWFGKKGTDGTPVHAVLFIAGVSFLVPFLGRTAIGFIVDVALIGASVAYAYTSAATFCAARASGNRLAKVTAVCGLALSVVVSLLFLLPNYFSGNMMAPESYLILVLWSILGFLFYRSVFRRDRLQRFGRSTVVWIALMLMMFFMSNMWMRQAAGRTIRELFDSLNRFHAEVCLNGDARDDGGWNRNLKREIDHVGGALMRDSLVQAGLMMVALAIMFSLYAILRRRERALEQEKMKAKSYFFSTVSHDIRTPLNAIIGFSEMLKSGSQTESEREQALDSISVSGKTLLGLINDVLDLSKLESGKMEISPKPTDCPRLLRELTAAIRVSNANPDVDLRCRVSEMPPLMLDPQRLRQIVFNLVGNALKFTEKGYVELRASCTRMDGAETCLLRIEVEDTGCGMSEEDIKRIGSAYVQVGAKLARNGGTGLGLAICRQLAAAMGGELGVKSELGKGSTFSITIPGVKPAKNAPGDGTSATTEPPDMGRTPAVTQTSSGFRPHPSAAVKRILIVDDSKMNLMVLKALLKNLGDFEVALARDGQEALKILETSDAKPFDIVLTDMWMPNLDGEGLVNAIRSNTTLSVLRVIVVTADVEIREKAETIGFDGILLKPVTTQTLGKIIGRAGEGESPDAG
ncbi:MAG: amino acid permease [Kiritimatiellae bacterium]|nr:amino acid permease [Kiritimatiellia bacterium]